jgi:hypothetical protein
MLHTVAVAPFCSFAPFSFTWTGDQTDSPYHNPACRCCSLVIAEHANVEPTQLPPPRSFLSVRCRGVLSASADPTTWRPSLSLQAIFWPGYGPDKKIVWTGTGRHLAAQRGSQKTRVSRAISIRACLLPKFSPKFHYIKRRFSVTSKCRHIYEILNIDEIKN